MDSIDALQNSSPFSAAWPNHSNHNLEGLLGNIGMFEEVIVFLAKRNQREKETGFPFELSCASRAAIWFHGDLPDAQNHGISTLALFSDFAERNGFEVSLTTN